MIGETYRPREGDKVVFGRRNGESTLGTVVKVNQTRAKIRQDQERGQQKTHLVGTVWDVPFALIRPVEGGHVVDPAEAPLPAFMSQEDYAVVQAIDAIYCALSPENLTCDGECPHGEVQRKLRELRYKLQCLFKALGRPVSETVVCTWRRGQEERHQKQLEEATHGS